LSLKLIK